MARIILLLLSADWPGERNRDFGSGRYTRRTLPTRKNIWIFCADIYAEMKYIIAALYSNYSTTVIDDTGIEQSDSYTAPPKGDKLLLRLGKLETTP